MSLMREKRGAVKRAQLSIFMILGVLLLLAGIVWFAIINATERESPVPREAAPLNAFITACVKDAGDAAMRQIGYTGGYADIPQSIAADSTSYLRAGPIDSLRQPYWWHDGVSSVPPLDFIREEAERMAAREFASCIDNLSAFRQTYNIAALREPIARVSFNEKDVSVSMSYPIHAATKDNATTFSQDSFEASLPIRFTRIYGLATTLMEREDKDAFIEHRTIDLMAMDENTIPLSGMEFDCSPRVWQQDAVRQRIQELMSVNLPFIKVQGTPYSTTQYVPQPEGEKETFGNSYYAQHYLWDLGAGDFGGLRTAFTYDPRWPMVFNARPGSNGLLKAEPQQGADILSKICLNIYHFTYDLSFPIKVDVIDDTPQQPYVFSFAFKASIDHNQPSRGNTGYALFDQEDTIVSDEYCANKDVEATVLTVDNTTGDPVKGVNLTFVCGRYSCDMGQTEWFGFGAAAGIVERFPRCVNGVLKAKAGGYLGSSQFMQTEMDGTTTLVFLTPTKEISAIKVVKHPLSNPGQAQLPSASETASIVLAAKDSEFKSYTLSPSSATLPLQFLTDTQHTYHVSIRLLTDEEVTGGYEGDWTPSLAQLQGAESITFHAVQQATGTDEEQFAFMSDLGTHSAKVPLPQLT